jgi:hypothetical protein
LYFILTDIAPLHHQVAEKFRDDGIVMTISVWQLVIELVTSISIVIYISGFLNHSKEWDAWMLGIIIGAIHFVVLPAFFLLADNGFRNSVRIHGGFNALWMLSKN